MPFDLETLVIGTSSVVVFCILIHLKSREKVERAVITLYQMSKMGTREIARSYSACMENLWAAGGAGVITAGTIAFKFLIAHSPLPLIASGLLIAVDFVASFLLMQGLGFRLATKQSSLLGAHLGHKWKELRAERLHEEVLWSLKTQLFSAAGNLAFVVPAAVIFHIVYLTTTGAPFLDPIRARAALQSLNPLSSGCLAFAAFTGCLLWLCTFLGALVAAKMPTFSKTTATGLFNILLGAALAFTPIIGKFTGLPLDVRHFTLSGGTVAIALASLGLHHAMSSGLVAAALGVLAIGALNFSVSFVLGFLASFLNGDHPRFRKAPVNYPAFVLPRGLTTRLT